MNYFKTALLLAGLTALFCGAGFLLGGQQGMMIALVMAVGMNLLSYWHSDKMLLKMYGARQIDSGDVYKLVQELARNAAIPMPKVYVIDTPQPNAFATGRNPENAAVAVTQGIVQVLSRRELRGVIAHELAHIKNRDTLIMTITATVAGALSMLANFAMFFGAGNQRDERSAGPVASIAVMILAPIAAMLVQMAISRTREYAADQGGAEISQDPEALASALEKIDYAAKQAPNHVAEQNPATAHLFIVNPLSLRTMDNLFATHPSTQNRIRALMERVGELRPTEESAATRRRGPWENVA